MEKKASLNFRGFIHPEVGMMGPHKCADVQIRRESFFFSFLDFCLSLATELSSFLLPVDETTLQVILLARDEIESHMRRECI